MTITTTFKVKSSNPRITNAMILKAREEGARVFYGGEENTFEIMCSISIKKQLQKTLENLINEKPA